MATSRFTGAAWAPTPLSAVLEASVSYAQNAEDIRLARVFSTPAGFYVDVGAGDPVEDSITKLFYDRGWSGINVEPGPLMSRLEVERPRDVNLQLAVSQQVETREFWISEPHPGVSTLYPPASAQLLPEGLHFERRMIECRPLSQILEEHAAGHAIDFLKIDVEGAEEDVLRSFDLRSIRPTVLVVEAVAPFTFEPSHESWEPLVLDAEFALAAFDGVNRFYVPRERQDLVDPLAYPVSTLDNYVPRKEVELRRALTRAEGGLHDADRRHEIPPATLLLEGTASRDELLATLTSLTQYTEEPFMLSILDERARHEVLRDDELRDALPPGVLGHARADESPSLTTLLTAAESDVVVVQAGAVLSPDWLDRLKAVAYSDSVCASASALVVPPAGSSVDYTVSELAGKRSTGLSPVIPGPSWGAVYIRRDALNLTAWALGESEIATLPLRTLQAALATPGLVHRRADDVVVRSSRARSGATRSNDDRHPASVGGGHAAPRRMPGKTRVMVDGRCFDRPLSGTQVHVLSLLKGLADTGEVTLSVLLPREVHQSVEPHLAAVDAADGSYTSDTLPEYVPGIFHRPYQFSGVGEVEACRSIGRYLVLTHQDMILDRTPAYHPSETAWEHFRGTTASAFAAADQVGFFSRHAAWDAASDGRLSADRINVVPLGVDHPLDGFESVERAAATTYPELDQVPYLLLVGGAYRHKNRLFALRLFDYLTTVHGWAGNLVFAGDHPSHGSSIPEEDAYLARHEALRDRVLDLGRVTDAHKRWLYEHARLVLFPSLYEGFGLVPFEAAACGTPCVYGWRSSLPEYLPQEGGVLEGWALPECADAVLRILEDQARARDLVAAIQAAGSPLTWAATARGYLDVYRRALAGPLRTSPTARTSQRALARRQSNRLSDAENRVLDVYRRRPLFRATIEATIGAGVHALHIWRTLRAGKR